MQNTSGIPVSSADLDVRRRKALYHAWHRGTREMDLLLGRFAEARIAALSTDELTDFEALMEVPDKDLMGWLLGRETVPAIFAGGVYDAVKAYALAHPLVEQD